ncbi:magnesium transporter [Collinsella sp. AF08-23]|uniref:magnesium transporter n=1 Tax=Collinsella sp. AF08-23 TaxID=2292211 RepID=UPI000E48D4AE|nr:CBS domain-containing protein [Collinsella sp. AF08-23]RHS41582.1 CBS domain-containing protein [Collinsella sp. AF08-23]
MNYLSEMLKLPVVDAAGEKIGIVNDLGIATGEVFPRVTALAFQGPGKTPFMISWRKYVERFDDDGVYLKYPATDIRFSYLQPDEVLLARDIMNKQIVDTQGMKVVRVNDIKLSTTGENQLRLLGAEVGARGLLRAIHPLFERVTVKVAKMLGKPLPEDIIAWSYMDLLERSTKQIKLSVSHKTLSELHPADIADIIEQLDPRLRTQVFAQLDTEQAAEAIAELDDDELMTEMLEGLSDREASTMLATMDPDDAAALIEELDYEKAEKLLRLMGVKEEKAIRDLLGYEEDTAGRIMTNQFVALPATATVQDAIDALRDLDEDFESIYYVYTTDAEGALTGVLSMRSLVVADHTDRLKDLAYRDVVWVAPDLDQEQVADEMTKYDLVAMPVCDENRHILGIVTVDDALDVIAEEHAEDLQIAGVSVGESNAGESTHAFTWFSQRQYWVVVWAIAACAIAAIVVTPLERLDLNVMGIATAHQMITSQGLTALMPISIMPVVLLASMRMVSFVKNSYLEYDERDDEPKPYLGFFLKTTLIGVILAAVVFLCGELMATTLFGEADPWAAIALLSCFKGAAAVIVGTYASAVIYFYVLFRSDEKDQSISGTSLTFAAVLLSALAYTVLGTLPLL